MSAPRTVLCLALLAAACGGGGSGNPSGPSTPSSPSPPPGNEVVAVVFYDENGNGVLDGGERARVPGVLVEIAGRSARSEKMTGRTVIAGVASGTYPATVRGDSLPPFYTPEPAPTVLVPQPAGQELAIPVALSIGSNRPNTYMAFGDSLTVGDGSTDGTGYRGPLQAALRGHFGQGEVLDRGGSGTRSGEGAERIARGLRALTPAYTLTLYGVNDWNDLQCRAAPPCFTIDSLRTIVRTVQGARSLPVLATIPPANPALNPAERNEWVRRMNELIRPIAREEGALLVDLEAAFLGQSDLAGLFADGVHPNDRGYGIIADAFFKALSGPGGSAAGLPLFFEAPFDAESLSLPGVMPVTRRSRTADRR